MRKISSLFGRGLLCSALAIAASGALGACSLVYDLSTKQCETTADCQALGGEFSELLCIDNLCKSSSEQGGCDTNAQCLDAPDSAGEPRVCMRDPASEIGLKKCVDLKTEGPECPLVLPDSRELWRENLRSDDVLVLGGFALLNETTLDSEYVRNYDMPLTELYDTMGGLPAGTGTRPVVMVVCRSNYDDTAQLDTSIDHLVQLKLPGVILGGLPAEDIQRAFERTTASAADVFFLSTNESDSTLVNLPDNGLVWQMGPGGGSVARAYAPLVERALAYQGITDTARVVDVLATGQRLLLEMDNVVISSPDNGGISFNGTSVFENNTNGNFKSIQVPFNADDPTADLTSQAQEILNFKPHVIIANAWIEFINKIVPVIEQGWAGVATDGQPRPFYLLSPLLYNSMAVKNLVGQFPGVRPRLVGVNPPAAEDPTLYQAYTVRFDRAYQAFAGARGYENYYDAGYYMIYAAAGAGNSLVDGADILRGMQRLLSGPRYDVGPDNMREAMGVLGTTRISLYGTLGPPLWDANTGSRTDVGTAWCLMANGDYRADVLRYNTDSKTMEGTLPCFNGF